MASKAIQLYTLREMDGSFTELLERVADAGFDGVEYAYRVVDEDPETVRETLEATGLAVPSAHVRIENLEDDLAATVERYRDLRCERMVVPALEAEDFATEQSTREAARRLDAVADELAEYDYSLHYHNHDFEFTDLDGRSALEVFLEESDDVGLELDVGLATWAGANPAELIEAYADRIELLHCTDANVDSEELAHASFGTGDVDFEPVFAAAEGADVEWLLYENGSHDDPVGELEHARESFVER